MAAPTFVSAGATSSGTGAITPGVPASIQADDILICLVQSSNQTISMSANTGGNAAWQGATWTEIGSQANRGTGTAASAGATRLGVWWMRFTSSMTAGTINVGDSGNHTLGIVVAFRGCPTGSSPINFLLEGVDTSATVASSGTAACTDGRRLVMCVAHARDANGAQLAADWLVSQPTVTATEHCDDSTNTGTGGGVACASDASTPTGNRGWNSGSTTSTNWGWVGFELLPGASTDFHACDTGSFSEAGGAGITLGLLPAGTGSYALSGGDLFAPQFQIIALDGGTFALTGGDGVLLGFLAGSTGSYSLTGGDAVLTIAQFIALTSGDFALTGGESRLLSILPGATGSFDNTGGEARLLSLLPSLAGDFSLTGGDAFLFTAGGITFLALNGGVFDLTGGDLFVFDILQQQGGLVGETSRRGKEIKRAERHQPGSIHISLEDFAAKLDAIERRRVAADAAVLSQKITRIRRLTDDELIILIALSEL